MDARKKDHKYVYLVHEYPRWNIEVMVKSFVIPFMLAPQLVLHRGCVQTASTAYVQPVHTTT